MFTPRSVMSTEFERGTTSIRAFLLATCFKRVVPSSARMNSSGTIWVTSPSGGGEGKLPHLAALRAQGCFKPLGSTLPPISPVAWSSFQTGVNPGKHNIFDFLIPDLRTYEPKLSSVEITPPRRTLRLGKYRIPLGKAGLRLLRPSRRGRREQRTEQRRHAVSHEPLRRLTGCRRRTSCPDGRANVTVESVMATTRAPATISPRR